MVDSLGINRFTGKALTDWDDVIQSCNVIFTTMIGTRVMRRTFGSIVPALLGRNLTITTLMRFFSAITVAIDLWEPRVRVVQVLWPPANTPLDWRNGKIEFQLIVAYRPFALQGDFTEESTTRTMQLNSGAGG